MSVFKGVGTRNPSRPYEFEAKFGLLNAGVTAAVANGRSQVATSGITIPLMVGQAARIVRYQSSLWDGANSGRLGAVQEGKVQIQFTPFGLTNSFAEYKGQGFALQTSLATTGIVLTPETGDFLTIIDDWVEWDDYLSVTGIGSLAPAGIRLQTFWQVYNTDGVNAHNANWSEVASVWVYERVRGGKGTRALYEHPFAKVLP